MVLKFASSTKKNTQENVVQFPAGNGQISPKNIPHATSLAEIFLSNLPNGVYRIVRDVGSQYFVFNGQKWKPISDEGLRQMIFKHSVITHIQHKKTLKAVNEIKGELDLLCHNESFGAEKSDTQHSTVNCVNGELWIDKQGSILLKSHNPDSLQFDCLPFPYDNSATCPLFLKALKEIFANSSDPDDLVRHVLEIIGYCLQNRRHIPMWAFLIGKGRNGKSKLLQTVSHLVGIDAVLNMSLDNFQKNQFNVIALRGKKLFIDDDMKTNTKLDDGLLKVISEAKDLTTRAAYGKSHVQITSRVAPLMASNSYPITADTSDGFKRRLHVIPFDRKFTEQEDNKELFTKIWATEMSGILNEAVKGYQRICGRGGFKPPVDCVKAAKKFMVYSNPLAEFVAEGCVQVESGNVTLKQFREQMNAWAKEQGHKITVPGHKLKSCLEDLGYETYEAQGYRRVKGIAFKNFKTEILDLEGDLQF